jgi:hypothetical protein
MPIAISSGLIGRFARLSSERRRLLLRASLVLTGASAAVALLPFRRAIRFGCVPLRQGPQVDIGRCIWAVETAARRLPWRTMCIEQGLAAQRILRAAGIDAVLHYGARHKAAEGVLEAHVWVTVDGKPVIGGAEAQDFASIASFS